MRNYEQERKEINRRYDHKINKINRRAKVKRQKLQAEFDVILAIIEKYATN